MANIRSTNNPPITARATSEGGDGSPGNAGNVQQEKRQDHPIKTMVLRIAAIAGHAPHQTSHG